MPSKRHISGIIMLLIIFRKRITRWMSIGKLFFKNMRLVSRPWKLTKTRCPIWGKRYVIPFSWLCRLCLGCKIELWNRRGSFASMLKFQPTRCTYFNLLPRWLRSVVWLPQLQMLRLDFSFLCIFLFIAMFLMSLCLGVTIFNVYENVFTSMI